MRFKGAFVILVLAMNSVFGQTDSLVQVQDSLQPSKINSVSGPTDSTVQAQDSIKAKMSSPQDVRQVVKTNPLPMLWGPIPLTSEFRIIQEITTGPYQSMQVGFSLLRKSPIFALFEDTLLKGANDRYTVKGWRFQFAHRFFVPGLGYAPTGIYVSPSFSFSRAIISTQMAIRQGYYLSATHYNLSALIGTQVLVLDGFTIDFFTGLGYQNRIWKEVDEQNNKTRNISMKELGLRDTHLKVSLGFNIGLAN